MKQRTTWILVMALAAGLGFAALDKAPCWSVGMKDAKITMSLPAEPDHQLAFTGLDASICFDAANLEGSEIIARIGVRSLTTEDAELTQHLLSSEFFDADKYPVIKFISTRIEDLKNGNYIAHGALAMKDSVQPVSIPFRFDGDQQKGVLKGRFSLFCGDYGIMKKSKSGSDKVVVDLEVPVARPK
jgi:polyisoprenoid-binding protein YceI